MSACSFTYEFVMQLPVMLESVQSILAGFLVALLLGVTFASAALVPANDNLCVEERRPIVRLRLVKQDELQGELMLLAPFKEFALEVHLLTGNLVDVYVAMQYLFYDEALAAGIPSVQIDSTYERLECITCQIAVVRLVVVVTADELVETYLYCQLAERFSLDNLATSVRQKAFTLAWKMMEDYFTHYGVQDSIAQELQAFIVERRPALGMGKHRLVQ